MPVTLKKGHIFYKNNSGTYTGLDVITDKATQQQIALIQNAKGYIFTQADQFIKNLKSSLPENFQTILENFSSTYIPENHQYTVGDYCTYEGVLYRCTAETDGAFDPADWEAVKVGTEFQIVDAEIDDLKSAITDACDYLNWYNPQDDYKFVASDGTTSRDSYVTKNSDGSLTCIMANGSTGQVIAKSQDTGKILIAGTYNLSARITLHNDAPDGNRNAHIRVGIAGTSPISVRMKTERGGDTNIGGSDKVGWVMGNFTISDEQVFSFEVEVSSSNVGKSSLPYVVDMIQITKSNAILDYTKKNYSANDNIARQIANDNTSVLNNLRGAREVELVLLNGARPYRDTIFSTSIIFPGASLYVVAKGTRTTVAYTDIVTQIPNNAVIDDRGLVVTLPTAGAFGYDTDMGVFKVTTNYVYGDTFVPLACRYYTVMWGQLIDDVNINGLLTSLHNEKAFIYTTSTARHSYSQYGSAGGVKLHIGSRLILRLINSQMNSATSTLDWSNISSEISDYITIDNAQADIIIPRYSMSLVYNVCDGLLHFREYNASPNYITPYDVVLFTIAYGHPEKGILYDEYINRLVEDMNASGGIDTDELKRQTFNASFHTGATDFDVKCKEFSTLMLGDTTSITAPVDFEPFLFFTDPHLVESSGWEDRCYEFISQIQKYYNSTPTDFCLCGGDWLGNSDLPDTACYKLGYIDGFMHSMFNNCYMIIGNHDTNYQGKKDADSATYTTKLSVQCRKNLWYKGQNAYFKFDGRNTRFYCFDTETENQTMAAYDNYGWTQAQWFANELQTDDSRHIAIAAHIFYYSSGNQSIQPLADWLSKIGQAYNNRTSITVNGTTYDYTGRTGRVEFYLAGHNHADLNGIYCGIPFIITTNVRHNQSLGASFDLCFVDYENRVFKNIRVGDGANRFISLDTGEVINE